MHNQLKIVRSKQGINGNETFRTLGQFITKTIPARKVTPIIANHVCARSPGLRTRSASSSSNLSRLVFLASAVIALPLPPVGLSDPFPHLASTYFFYTGIRECWRAGDGFLPYRRWLQQLMPGYPGPPPQSRSDGRLARAPVLLAQLSKAHLRPALSSVYVYGPPSAFSLRSLPRIARVILTKN